MGDATFRRDYRRIQARDYGPQVSPPGFAGFYDSGSQACFFCSIFRKTAK